MNRLDALIILSLASIAVGSVWCAMMYQQELAAYFGFGVFVLTGVYHKKAEELTRLDETKRLTHYTWRRKK